MRVLLSRSRRQLSSVTSALTLRMKKQRGTWQPPPREWRGGAAAACPPGEAPLTLPERRGVQVAEKSGGRQGSIGAGSGRGAALAGPHQSGRPPGAHPAGAARRPSSASAGEVPAAGGGPRARPVTRGGAGPLRRGGERCGRALRPRSSGGSSGGVRRGRGAAGQGPAGLRRRQRRPAPQRCAR